jgi:hypothetical protein
VPKGRTPTCQVRGKWPKVEKVKTSAPSGEVSKIRARDASTEEKSAKRARQQDGPTTQQRMHELLLRVRAKEALAAATSMKMGEVRKVGDDGAGIVKEQPMKKHRQDESAPRLIVANVHGGTLEEGGSASSCSVLKRTASEAGHGEMQGKVARRRVSTKRPG